ncbi:S41 family peptidase [Bacterioplanoides sp.]|uniref:S41 family peptidase n=1 Tax=Bacterioplanoides sp. TaxID=2066072 RepID=UPI003B58F970
MKTLASSFFTLVVSSVLTACGSGDSDNNNNSDPGQNSADQGPYQGIWLAPAYGEAKKIDGKKLTEYQYTSDYCRVSHSDNDFTEQDARDAFYSLNTTNEPATLQARLTIHGVDFRDPAFSQTTSLPASCNQPLDDSNASIEFAWFSQLFEEYYPTFNERNVNWQSVVQSASQNLTDSSTALQLIQAMAKSIQPLADSHVSLVIEDLEVNFERQDSTQEQRLAKEFIAANGEIDSEAKAQAMASYIEQQTDLTNSIRLSYAANEDEIKLAGNNRFGWFITDDNIGVLIIEGMEEFTSAEDNPVADINKVAELMPQIINDLQDTQGLVIDIRNNEGGFDGVSQLIARHFLDSERALYRKQARLGSARTPAETYRLAPASNTYLKPTVVLTSGTTVSAAEVFTLMMRELPQVSVIGEVTQGALSDVLEKELPSGIKVNLVNEYYLSMDGELFEVSGIPVDKNVAYATQDQRQNRRDDGLLAAFNQLRP